LTVEHDLGPERDGPAEGVHPANDAAHCVAAALASAALREPGRKPGQEAKDEPKTVPVTAFSAVPAAKPGEVKVFPRGALIPFPTACALGIVACICVAHL